MLPQLCTPMSPHPPHFNLPGNGCHPQVQPDASYWAYCPLLRVPTFPEVLLEMGVADPFYLPGSDEEGCEMELLHKLAIAREDQALFNSSFSAGMFSMQTILSPFLTELAYTSAPPRGSFLNNRQPVHQPFIRNGGELARLFEAETPGYWHRHVLSVIADTTFDRPGCQPARIREFMSPPKITLMTAALEMAIFSALAAAWHFKWLHHPGTIARRRRPYEADPALSVLYDTFPHTDQDGNVVPGDLRMGVAPSPGTPRHPAYPSGHSTYSAAASEVLGCLLPDFKAAFDQLADNIGHARLWGGVHLLSDHTFGQKVGRAVGRLIIAQFNASGIAPMGAPVTNPPSVIELDLEAELFRTHCGDHPQNFCAGIFRM